MNHLLIAKASSRLGMKFIPHGGVELNLGVETGPDAVLDANFLQKIEQTNSVDLFDYTFSDPDHIDAKTYYPIIAEESAAFANELEHMLEHKKYSGVITIGGDHGVGYATFLGLLRYHKNKKVGIISFDSHADLHLQKTSPSGNFHGMWLRPFFEKFDDESIASVVNVKIDPHNFLYVGNLIIEEEEVRFIKEKNIATIDSKMIEADITGMIKKIADLCANVDVIHVTFDVDVFKQSIVSATGTPNPDGFEVEMVTQCIKPIIDSGKLFSMDLVEVNPKKENSGPTIAIGQMIIEQFLPGFQS
ncbi:MAG: arginase family protein [bacterium]